MKYITTDKHPELKEGIIIQASTTEDVYYLANDYGHRVWEDLEEEYIQEVKEFTRSELIEICYIRFGGEKDIFIKNLNPVIDGWLKQRTND